MYSRHKKGQAAMEFLMTYGWAILAAIIAIGVLAYFGVFNPNRLAGSTAVLNAPLNVDTFNIVSDDATNCGGNDCISMVILQNSGGSIDVTNATVTLTSGGTGICEDTGIPATWTSGTQQTANFDCGGAGVFESGAAIAGEVTITYTETGENLVQQSSGNVRGVAQ